MKPKTVAVLAALVLTLGAFIWFVERDLPGTDERAEQARKVLGGIEREDVEAVTIVLEGRRVHLERVDEPAGNASWRLTSPVEFPADDAAVKRLLSTLARLEKQSSVDAPDPVDLGLEPPKATVTVRTLERERALRVGVEVPVAGGRVVSLEDVDQVWVTEGELWDEIARDPKAWRSKRAVPFSASEVLRLRLSGESLEEPVEIVRESPGESSAPRFRLTAPVDDAADRQTVQELTSRLATLRIADFVDNPSEAPEAADLDSPRYGVDLFTELSEDAEAYRLELLTRVGEGFDRWLTRVDGRLVETESGELVELLDRPAFAWRSRLLTDLQIFELHRVRIRREGRDDMVLARQEGDWTRDGEALPYGPVRELLLQLTGARAVEVEAGGGTGPQEHSGVARILFELEPNVEGLPVETVAVHVDNGALVPVEVQPRGVVLPFEASVLEELEAALRAVGEAEPLESETGPRGPVSP